MGAVLVTLIIVLLLGLHIYNVSRREQSWGWNHPHAVGAKAVTPFTKWIEDQGHSLHRSKEANARILLESLARSLCGHEHKSIEQRRKLLKRQAYLIIRSRWKAGDSGGQFDQFRIGRLLVMCGRMNDVSEEMTALVTSLNAILICSDPINPTFGQRQLALTYAYIAATILRDEAAINLITSGSASSKYISLTDILKWAES